MIPLKISILFLALLNDSCASQIHDSQRASEEENSELTPTNFAKAFFNFGEDLSAYELFKDSEVKDDSVREKPEFEESDLFFNPVLSENKFDGVEEGDDPEVTIEMPYSLVSPKTKTFFREKDK